MTFLGYEWFNDTYLIPFYLLGFLGYLFVLFVSVVFHEFGHIIYFRINKINTKSRWLFFKEGTWMGVETVLEDTNNKQHLESLWSGTLMGLVPIAISGFVFFPSLLLVLPYAYVIKSDLKEIFRNTKLEEEDFE